MILRAQLQKTKELLAPPLPENKLPSCTDFVLVAADLSGTLQRSDTALEPANKRHNQCTTAITGATVSASPSLLSCPRTESGAPSVGGCPDPQQMAGPSPHSASRPPGMAAVKSWLQLAPGQARLQFGPTGPPGLPGPGMSASLEKINQLHSD
uniref:Uncharacterized protein n=1 Tax=Rangifer tarandus platyrhynchus TaxID=3082113 RepID=A0ACB0FM24_RANTA|nr:unnamed protein product [Rangifer tarandus platyrhynchus]